MKVDAEELNKYVNIAVNGMGKKGLNSLNTAITLQNDNGKLSLLTTTGIATLKVSTDIPTGNFTGCSIENTIFVQLLSRLVGDIELTIEDGRSLVIRGSGEYKLAIIPDYNGEFAFIEDVQRVAEDRLVKLDIEELTRTIDICKHACPEDLNVPIHYNIYYGEEAMATNDEKLIVVPNRTGFKGLLSVHNLGIIKSVFKGNVSYMIDGKTLVIQDDTSVLVTAIGDASEFPSQVVAAITLNNKFEVEYEQIRDVIEKGKLFMTAFDRNQINIELGTDGMTFTSKSSDFNEDVPYCSPNQIKPLGELHVNLLDLSSVLESCVPGPITMSCESEEGPIVITQGEYKGLVSLYE